MKREIVIAAYSEPVGWIPQHWRDEATVYRCGEKVTIGYTQGSHSLQRLMAMSGRPQHHPHNQGDMFMDTVERVRVLLTLLDEMRPARPASVVQGGSFAEVPSLNDPKGREATQWLNHIVRRYDTLAEQTFFLQGNPFDHCPSIVMLVDSILPSVPFSTLPPSSGSTVDDLVTTLGQKVWGAMEEPVDPQAVGIWAAGAQFMASKALIHRRTKEWYARLRDVVSAAERSGEIMERTWWKVFGVKATVREQATTI